MRVRAVTKDPPRKFHAADTAGLAYALRAGIAVAVAVGGAGIEAMANRLQVSVMPPAGALQDVGGPLALLARAK